MFAGSVAVSHGYFHLLEFGVPVEVGDLRVSPGEVLHGDRHGVVRIPPAIARDLPATAERLAELERSVLAVANSPHPSLEDLRRVVQQSVEPNGSPRRSR
jgi:regulator of RNase E activity RraA